MAPSTLIDVSVPLRAGMPIYHDNPGFEIHLDSALADGAGANVSKVMMGAHTGTHVDGPVSYTHLTLPTNREV